ncbi:hypothetical protein HK103_006228 [Boothiomyces macroporosus]|uniref:Uncharacterized protein n=1 Tax=Boothiomyces macroporosus TaxID=261099 RepID=A0AAD5UEM9_9FUNG|nr:hypothetical protein HK103_006228 [Boothiomyces macroporosus]
MPSTGSSIGLHSATTVYIDNKFYSKYKPVVSSGLNETCQSTTIPLRKPRKKEKRYSLLKRAILNSFNQATGFDMDQVDFEDNDDCLEDDLEINQEYEIDQDNEIDCLSMDYIEGKKRKFDEDDQPLKRQCTDTCIAKYMSNTIMKYLNHCEYPINEDYDSGNCTVFSIHDNATFLQNYYGYPPSIFQYDASNIAEYPNVKANVK